MGSWCSLGAGEEDTLSLGPQSCKAWLEVWTSRDSREHRISGHVDSQEVRQWQAGNLGLQEMGEE